jgi:hypothetical protein
MKEKIILILSLVVLSIGEISAQNPTPTKTPTTKTNKIIVITKDNIELPKPQNTLPQPSPSLVLLDLPTILEKANEQTGNYREEFKNLLGDETKTFETFDKNGKSKKQSTVESNFVVYQSAKNENLATEYRNVVKVDGKTVGGSEKRATDLFTQLSKSASAQQELEGIQKESSRYDKNLDISGLTLLQAPILAEHIRPFFDFQLLGRETLDGREMFSVSYQQTKVSPYILFNTAEGRQEKLSLNFEEDLPNSIQEPNARVRGKMWIDAQTFQIRREERELTIQPTGLQSPLVIQKTEFEYQPSDLGILVPKRITLSGFTVKSKDKGTNISAFLDTKATFQYNKFTKSDVEVKSGEVKN